MPQKLLDFSNIMSAESSYYIHLIFNFIISNKLINNFPKIFRHNLNKIYNGRIGTFGAKFKRFQNCYADALIGKRK